MVVEVAWGLFVGREAGWLAGRALTLSALAVLLGSGFPPQETDSLSGQARPVHASSILRARPGPAPPPPPPPGLLPHAWPPVSQAPVSAWVLCGSSSWYAYVSSRGSSVCVCVRLHLCHNPPSVNLLFPVSQHSHCMAARRLPCREAKDRSKTFLGMHRIDKYLCLE